MSSVHVCNVTFAVFREVITLYDLEQHLCQLLRVESYDRLQLGPLLRAPIIVQHFNPPSSLLKVPKVLIFSGSSFMFHFQYDCSCMACTSNLSFLHQKFNVDRQFAVLQIMYSNVVEAVKHLVTPKNSQVQPHAVLQWLTREFDVEMPQVRLVCKARFTIVQAVLSYLITHVQTS